MSDITYTSPARHCPGCGYVIAQLELIMLRFDMPCPRCKAHTTNEFERGYFPAQPEPPKPGKRRPIARKAA